MSIVIDQLNARSTIPPTSLVIPPGWPTHPTPGKLALLFDANSKNIYHRFSPYTDYHTLFGFFKDKQPFIYRYPDEPKKSFISTIPSQYKSLLGSVVIEAEEAVDDVVRVAKFSVSSHGIVFLAKQQTLQLLQPFDETRLYNPISPVLASVYGLTLGFGLRPKRHIEGGILGILNTITSTVGIDLQSEYSTPSSTVGDGALPASNKGQGKGLIRGQNASKAYSRIQSLWAISSAQKSQGLQSMFTMASNAARSLIANTIPTRQSSTYRADETMYQMMASSFKLKSYTQGGIELPLTQMWFGGKGWTPRRWHITILPNSVMYRASDSGVEGKPIKERPTGYTIDPATPKYSQNVKNVEEGSLTNSDMLVQFAEYADPQNKFTSKLTDQTAEQVKMVNDTLQNVINNIRIKTDGTYGVTFTDNYSYLLSTGKVGGIGYDRLFSNVPKNPNTPKSLYGVLREYNSSTNAPKTLDKTTSQNNLRMATSFVSDGMNRLGILKKDRSIPNDMGLKSVYPKWDTWNPYTDDLIAFFFYDVVNEKYIPFRATVKGISEGGTAFWDEMRFIGRADQLYSYNGFNRTLSFTFNVVINSITELLPTWKKINYMAGTVKPSNYTVANTSNDATFNRFIVPPMFMLTIGDLYKFQPIIITSVNVNIPDDASWETLNELNSDEWQYLNGIIKSSQAGKMYAQLPREVEIAITCNLLEKERAIVGSANFGHAPHTNMYVDGEFNVDTGSQEPYLPQPTDFHKALIEFNDLGQEKTNDNRTNNIQDPPPSPMIPISDPLPSGMIMPPITSTPTTAGQMLGPQIVIPNPGDSQSRTNRAPNILTQP